MTSLAQERRIRKQQKESFSSQVTFHPGLYNAYHHDDDDEDSFQAEEDRLNSNTENNDNENISGSNNPASKSKDNKPLSREALENLYNQEEIKKHRKPSTRPTLAKLAAAVVSPQGFVAIPGTCSDYTKSAKVKSKSDTAGAAVFLRQAMRAYQEVASDWAPGWSWQEACLACEQLGKQNKKYQIKSFLEQQRQATREAYLYKQLGSEQADRLLQAYQLETAAAARRAHDDEYHDEPMPNPGHAGQDEDNVGELEDMRVSPSEDQKEEEDAAHQQQNNNITQEQFFKKRRVIDDEEEEKDEELEFVTGSNDNSKGEPDVHHEQPAASRKKRRSVIDDYSGDEELEVMAAATSKHEYENDGAANRDKKELITREGETEELAWRKATPQKLVTLSGATSNPYKEKIQAVDYRDRKDKQRNSPVLDHVTDKNDAMEADDDDDDEPGKQEEHDEVA